MKIKLKISYSLCILLLSVFSIMRIYRNSLGYSATGVGGIWNVISLYFVILAILTTFGILRRKYKYSKGIIFSAAFSLLSQLHVLFFAETVSISTIYNFLMIGYFASILIVFFVASQDGLGNKQIWLSIVMSGLITIMSFISVFWFRSGRLSFSMVSNAYYALCILPFVILISNNKKVNLIFYIAVGAVVIFSGKRTGLIAFALFILTVALFEALHRNKLNDFLKTVFVVTIAIIAFYYLYNRLAATYDLRLLQRMTTLLEDGGSGRDDIYRQIWEGMKNSKPINWIFGHGYGSSDQVILKHATAHDDFLEILYDYGLIPTILFILFYVRLFIETRLMFKANYEKAHVFLGGLLISLILSLFSTYCVSFAYVSCGMAFLGTALGQWERYKETN